MIQEHSCPQEAGGDSNPASPLDQTEERIGQAFRRMREHYGESQRAVAAALKISVDQLDSLEKGAYERLPGRVYILGWARAYASYLGLDVHDTLSYLKRELKEGEDCPTAARTELLWTERFSHIEKSVPQWSIALASVIGLAVLYGILAIWNRDDLNNEKLSSVDLPTFQTATEFEARAINKDNDSEFSTQSVSPSLLDGHKGEVENEELTPSSSSLSSIHANSAGIPLTGSLEAGNIVRSLDQPHKEHNLGGGTDLSGSSTRIRLLANEPSWVSIRDTLNQKTLLTQIMEKGDIFDVPSRPGLVMTTGNAGGLIIEVDGSPIPTLGPLGSVRRGIRLDPEKLIRGHAYIPPSERPPSEREARASRPDDDASPVLEDSETSAQARPDQSSAVSN